MQLQLESPLSLTYCLSSSPILQAGGVQLRGAFAPKGSPGVPQHSAMAQCTAPLRCHRAQQQHPTPAASHQVLHYCLQVSLLYMLYVIIVTMLHSSIVVLITILIEVNYR